MSVPAKRGSKACKAWLSNNYPKPGKTFPFREHPKLALRNSVSTSGGKTSGTQCIQEMSVMFACMKKNDFNELNCSIEIQAFQKCYKDHETKLKELKENEDKGGYTGSAAHKRWPPRLVNNMMKKFPQFND